MYNYMTDIAFEGIAALAFVKVTSKSLKYTDSSHATLHYASLNPIYCNVNWNRITTERYV